MACEAVPSRCTPRPWGQDSQVPARQAKGTRAVAVWLHRILALIEARLF
jgi:hypothetical protein